MEYPNYVSVRPFGFATQRDEIEVLVGEYRDESFSRRIVTGKSIDGTVQYTQWYIFYGNCIDRYDEVSEMLMNFIRDTFSQHPELYTLEYENDADMVVTVTRGVNSVQIRDYQP